jgi:hypothetical protein
MEENWNGASRKILFQSNQSFCDPEFAAFICLAQTCSKRFAVTKIRSKNLSVSWFSREDATCAQPLTWPSPTAMLDAHSGLRDSGTTVRQPRPGIVALAHSNRPEIICTLVPSSRSSKREFWIWWCEGSTMQPDVPIIWGGDWRIP